LGPGIYSLRFSFANYRAARIPNIRLLSGEHYKLDIGLVPENQDVESAQNDPGSKSVTRSEGREFIGVTGFSDGSENTSGAAERKKMMEKPEGEKKTPPVLGKAEVYRRQSQPLHAAAHNDNEEYPYFLDYLERYNYIDAVYHKNFENRFVVRLMDGQGQPVHNQPFSIVNRQGEILWEAVSFSDGENVFFPHFSPAKDNSDKLYVQINREGERRILEELNGELDRITTLQLQTGNNREKISLDLLFILDTTGSMGDEIQQLKDNLYSIYTRITNYFSSLPIRFGLVVYRDHGDEYVARRFKFTSDIDRFQRQVDAVVAAGGGDYPEDVQQALQVSLKKMDWSKDAVKVAFLVADAPPHVDYGEKYTYIDAAMEANRRGIKLFTIGASGLNTQGEYIFRQISALSCAEFIFLTYGERGESSGADVGKVSHHTGDNYESHNLDDLVVNCVKRELSYRIPGVEITYRPLEPQLQEGYLQIRMDNLWSQIAKQLKEFLPEKPVAVMAPIETRDGDLDELAGFLQQISTVSLIESHRITLVERERLEEILTEQGLTLAGLIRDKDYSKLGYLLGSNIVFLGDLSTAGMDRVIFMRAVRTDDARILAAARIRL